MARKSTSRLPREVFISHSSRNQKFVERLVDVLRDHGVPTWVSSRSLIGAQQWHDEIGAALSRCDWFAVVLSKDAVRSEWVKRELVRALRDSRYDGRIIPLLNRQCDLDKLSWTLRQMQIVDFVADEQSGFRDLLRIWGIGLKP
ncbi:MAG: toll/interleukin-1 receptor domain-containing protein [Pirellulales bacterium]